MNLIFSKLGAKARYNLIILHDLKVVATNDIVYILLIVI